MTLSDAIIEGSKKGPQCYGRWFGNDSGSSCALGAVLISLGLEKNETSYNFVSLAAAYPLLDMKVISPITDQLQSLAMTIVELNDGGGWSREEIADWVKGFENISTKETKSEKTLVLSR